MRQHVLSHHLDQADPVQLHQLEVLELGALALILLIAGTNLAGWVVPQVGRVLPAGWTLMKANTAACALMSALSFALSRRGDTARSIAFSRVLAGVVTAVSLAVLCEYFFKITTGIDTFVAKDAASLLPGRMSPQSAAVYLLLGVSMLLIGARERATAAAADGCAFTLCLLVLTILSGYCFGAVRVFGSSMQNRTAPQTLVCFMLLAFVTLARRAESGVFRVLLGEGIGGRIARIAAPISLALPFVLDAGCIVLARGGAMNLQYAAALTTSLVAMLAFALVIVLARRIDEQEQEIRELSLRDGLTDLYNRRGFYLLAEQALRHAQRSGNAFSVLFIDLDNLKPTNDLLGHEAGSALLKEIADLLCDTFRNSDIIGRVGGDEFVVAGEATQREMQGGIERLEQACAERNRSTSKDAMLSFSVGCVTAARDGGESLDALVSAADQAMYQAKARRKAGQRSAERATPTRSFPVVSM